MEVNGFESSEVLDTRVRAVVDGGAAEQWDKLSKTIDLTNAIDRAIYTVVALSSVGGTATVGTLVVAGAMSGPVGWSVLGGIGAATAVVSIVTIVASAITGKMMQERLKDVVEDLFHARADAFLQVRRMTLICDWMRILIPHLGSVKNLEEKKLKRPDEGISALKLMSPELWSINETHKMLASRDRCFQEWTGADPEPRDEFILVSQDHDRSIWKGDFPRIVDQGAQVVQQAVNRVDGVKERAAELAKEASGHAKQVHKEMIQVPKEIRGLLESGLKGSPIKLPRLL
ncbi:MAG: hypothetical protein CL912_15655 [Deltaproteobacteria bacterium]|nr:hypothetical protein [Deltaproteobacteria bacterium]